MPIKKNNKKLTKKEYIAKYIFLKILFGDFKINDYVYSESIMSKHFKTTNATIRTAYNNLIQKGILKAVKGKGYIVLKNIASYLFDHYDNLNLLKNIKENNTFNYFNSDNKLIVKLTFHSDFINKQNKINDLLDIFKIIFSRLEFDHILLKKTYSYKSTYLINHYQYFWNNQLVLNIELKSHLNFINLFNYQKHFSLN